MTVRKHQNLREGVIALVVLIVVFIVVYALQLRWSAACPLLAQSRHP
jgi:hypothetical protein